MGEELDEDYEQDFDDESAEIDEDDDDTIEDAVSTNSNKLNKRRAKILRRKLLKKYMKLRRIVNLIEKKLNVREKKFIKLNKFVKLNGPVGHNRFSKLISEVDRKGP